MTSKTKCYIFISFFSVSVVLFFLLSHFPVGCQFFNSFGIFRHEHDNFIFLMLVFVFVSYVITELAVYADRFAARIGWHTSKIGKILVSQRYITQEELYRALKEQNLRIGEVLIQKGRISPKQLGHALEIQKKSTAGWVKS